MLIDVPDSEHMSQKKKKKKKNYLVLYMYQEFEIP